MAMIGKLRKQHNTSEIIAGLFQIRQIRVTCQEKLACCLNLPSIYAFVELAVEATQISLRAAQVEVRTVGQAIEQSVGQVSIILVVSPSSITMLLTLLCLAYSRMVFVTFKNCTVS